MLAPLMWLVLLGGMLLSMEAGMRLRARQLRAAQKRLDGLRPRSRRGFPRLGLVIPLHFSGAASRFDHRRDLIVEEANDIGTAYLRIALDGHFVVHVLGFEAKPGNAGEPLAHLPHQLVCPGDRRGATR